MSGAVSFVRPLAGPRQNAGPARRLRPLRDEDAPNASISVRRWKLPPASVGGEVVADGGTDHFEESVSNTPGQHA
ncbi:hypothetical protein [Nonomuraea sp. NPDC049400]|uniref:hypothetical protein n=1 Tax=Nonomuraea sp. NPDC049400 TaxID=3364352 RepID=UPI0037B7FCD6